MEFQSGPLITALTRLVTYDWPELTGPGGCSLTAPDGTTHDTAGKRAGLGGVVEVVDRLDVAELAVVLDGVEVRQRVPDARVSWRSARTGAHDIAASFSQSGSVPLTT